jgi:sugar-specific transcriptional regulator TrmB/DNA-binding CsgD family transcriptional regulator
MSTWFSRYLIEGNMTALRIASPEGRALEILGISEEEENLYRLLLAHSGVTLREIAELSSLDIRKARRLLDAIEGKGLATHSSERPSHYIPASPDIALDELILQRQKALHHAQAAAQALQEYAVAQRHEKREQLVELIANQEAESQAFRHIQRTAQDEIVSLVRPPLRITRLEASWEDDETQKITRSLQVRRRSIADAEFLELPDALRIMRAEADAGVEVRTFPHLPFKMFLADRHIALIPLALERPDSPVLLVRSSALLDALYVMFEMLWQRATPLSFTHADKVKGSESDPLFTKDAEALIALMVAGLNDKTIAYELEISTRTLERRVAELLRLLDARTRFQAGWRATLRQTDTSD